MKRVLAKYNDKWKDITEYFKEDSNLSHYKNFDYIQVLYDNGDIKKYNNNDKIENNIIFRNLCLKHLSDMCEKQLVSIKQNLDNEAVFIEFRILPHVEFLIRNAIDKLGENWSQTIVCGNINYQSICEIVKNIGLDIKIIKLDYNNLNQATYSKLLASLEFWDLIIGEKVLIHQEDSCIFKYNIDEFLEWDYIGAPWKHDVYKDVKVGNGGFSLRSKSIMKQIINKIAIKKYKSKYLVYDKEMVICPEDVYFVSNMYEYKIGKIAPFEIAKLFSTESINEINSLGGHQFWLCDINWENRIKYNMLIMQNNLTNQQKNIVINYPNLFHKYLLNISNLNSNISYIVTKKAVINKKLISHIHCYKLEFLSTMFLEYIDIIIKYFDIIVTYVIDDNNILDIYNNITFIKQENYGADIGGKFHVVDYLNKNNVDYSHIFFIHSKSDDELRLKYITPFIKNIDIIVNKLINNNICIINNLLTNEYKWNVNKLYMEELIKYYDICVYDYKFTEFIQGNFYILNKKIALLMFGDIFIYNILNTKNSFDYNWNKIYYKYNKNIIDVYNHYIKNKLYGNNIETQLGWNGLADAMIEHVFERIVLLLCKKYNIDIFMVNNTQINNIDICYEKNIKIIL